MEFVTTSDNRPGLYWGKLWKPEEIFWHSILAGCLRNSSHRCPKPYMADHFPGLSEYLDGYSTLLPSTAGLNMSVWWTYTQAS